MTIVPSFRACSLTSVFHHEGPLGLMRALVPDSMTREIADNG